MPFLRFTRDKRGYEQFALVHSVNRRGKSVSRVLYWYRTPPDVKVGREPFDDAVRRALEAQNPDITFDWRQILETPIPSADADKWRERRRTERIERAAREAFDREDERQAGGEPAAPADAPKHVLEVVAAAATIVDTLRTIEGPEFTTRESVVESVSEETLSETLILPPSLKLRRTAEAQSAEAGRTPQDEPRVEGPALSEPLRVEGPALSEPLRVEGSRRRRRRRRGRGRPGASPPLSGTDPAAARDRAAPTVAEGEEPAADTDE